jgi:serpin B
MLVIQVKNKMISKMIEMTNRFSILFVFLLLILSACDDDNKQNPTKDISGAAEIGPRIESFGLELFKTTYREASDGTNLCIAPLSICSALSMTLNGAEGQTKTDILRTLDFEDFSLDSINAGFQSLQEQMEPMDDQVRLASVNALFWDETRILPYYEFIEAIQFGFDAEIQDLDFRQKQNSLDHMNQWVEDHTESKIKNLLKTIKDTDALFLINALYFKGAWNNPFHPNMTREGEFHTASGVESTSFMNHDAPFSHYIGNDYSAVDLPFGESDYSMTLILPPSLSEMDSFVEEIDSELLKLLYTERLQTERIQFKVPKFEIEYEINLKDALSTMGMGIAFDWNRADFSKLGDAFGRNLFIDRVQHKNKLIVDEKGIEGSAATAVVIAIDSAPPALFFNRPFVYIIRHKETQTILFIGCINKPTN